MGTTATALAILGDRAHVGHVGDSRLYLIHDGEGSQVTRDHELRNGALLNCLGSSTGAHVETEVHEFDLRPGDALVLCTDGLGDCAGAATVASLVGAAVRRSNTAQSVADTLVEHALVSGGRDNVTVVVVSVR